MIVKPLLIKITSSNGTPMDVCMKVIHSIKFCKETSVGNNRLQRKDHTEVILKIACHAHKCEKNLDAKYWNVSVCEIKFKQHLQ